MGEFVKVANKSDLPPGEGMVVEVNGNRIALFNVNGEFYALDNTCPHRGGPLGEGYCDPINLTVQCPWHGWTYSVRSGKAIIPPVGIRVPTYAVRVEGDDVYVTIDWPDG